MSYSYYEVYTNAQRAFSGLGFPYGADEDAAFIISWLEAFELNGIHLFETINNFNEMNTFIKENKELLDFNSIRNELITIYNNYYSNCL